jgi:type II secretory pathway component PulC
MRFARLLCLALLVATPSLAAAETAKPAAKQKKLPPYRLVRILPETNQALLLDKNRGKHVLVDVGDSIGAYQVLEIESDQVVLGKENDSREYVLVAGEATPTTRVADPYPMPDPVPTTTTVTLLDPYPAGVLDPYGSEGVREVQAPADQRAEKKVEAPPPVKEEPKKEEPKKVEEVAPPAPVIQTEFTVVRKELNKALSDFGKIGKDLQMTVVDDGVSIDHVATDSFFFKMGLRDGDLVKKVDGKVIRGMDDAATIYARMGKMKKFTVEIVRAGAPLTLRYQISK